MATSVSKIAPTRLFVGGLNQDDVYNGSAPSKGTFPWDGISTQVKTKVVSQKEGFAYLPECSPEGGW